MDVSVSGCGKQLTLMATDDSDGSQLSRLVDLLRKDASQEAQFQFGRQSFGKVYLVIDVQTMLGLVAGPKLPTPVATQESLEPATANQPPRARRTNVEKRRDVEKVFANPKSSEWSDSRIAEHVGVSAPFVANIRQQRVVTVTGTAEPAKRVGRNGKRYKYPIASSRV